MRSLFAVSLVAIAAMLSACATQEKAPAPAEKAQAPAATAATKKPQCWNGDLGAFQDVGTKATIAGVAVECKPTADGKSGQWVGAKH